MQYMTRDVCLSEGPPGGIVSHFVGRVYKPYICIAIYGFACGQEINDLTDGAVNQLSVDKILKFSLSSDWSVGHSKKYPTLISMT